MAKTKVSSRRKVVAKSSPRRTTKKTAVKKTTKKIESKKVEHLFGDPVISEFKGNMVMALPLIDGGRYSLNFGLSKAKAIVEYFEEIKQFVADNTKS